MISTKDKYVHRYAVRGKKIEKEIEREIEKFSVLEHYTKMYDLIYRDTAYLKSAVKKIRLQKQHKQKKRIFCCNFKERIL